MGKERFPALFCTLSTHYNERRKSDSRFPILSEALDDERFIKPRNVIVTPMVGIMGTTNPRVEANRNAARLAELFDGESKTLPHNAFIEKEILEDGTEDKQDMDKLSEEFWNGVDIAIYTCEEVQPFFGKKVKAQVPSKLYDDVKTRGAVGEIGGLYLGASGEELEPDEYSRVGIKYEQLRGVAEKGGAILLAGVQRSRLEPVLSALHARSQPTPSEATTTDVQGPTGIVSVFVTHRAFAWEVLQLHLERNSELETGADAAS